MRPEKGVMCSTDGVIFPVSDTPFPYPDAVEAEDGTLMPIESVNAMAWR